MDTYKIWRKGFSLEYAWYNYASKDQKNEYDRLLKQYGGPEYLKKLLEYASNYIAQSANDMHEKPLKFPDLEHSQVTDLEKHLKNRTLNWVNQKRLIGYGFEKPRKSTDIPVRVPDDLWRNSINWRKSTLTSGSLSVENVRIVHYKHIEQLGFQSNGTKRKPGRPSQKVQIVNAYETLLQLGKIVFSKPLSAHYQAIRKQVLLANPDDARGLKGLGDETIRRTLNMRFNQDKKTASSKL